MANKSSISVAHRIDTIKNSKIIYVFSKGRIAESGNYEELLKKRDIFTTCKEGGSLNDYLSQIILFGLLSYLPHRAIIGRIISSRIDDEWLPFFYSS